MSKKPILLFLALLLPILVFLFLKFFGKNEFNVPVYYDTGAMDYPTPCGAPPATPYVVTSSAIEFKVLTVVAFPGQLSEEKRRDFDFELKRIANDFRGKEVNVVQVLEAPAEGLNLTGEVMPLDSGTYHRLKSCELLVKDPNVVVLVDDARRIRGYYEPSRKEMERLTVELKIILKDY